MGLRAAPGLSQVGEAAAPALVAMGRGGSQGDTPRVIFWGVGGIGSPIFYFFFLGGGGAAGPARSCPAPAPPERPRGRAAGARRARLHAPAAPCPLPTLVCPPPPDTPCPLGGCTGTSAPPTTRMRPGASHPRGAVLGLKAPIQGLRGAGAAGGTHPQRPQQPPVSRGHKWGGGSGMGVPGRARPPPWDLCPAWAGLGVGGCGLCRAELGWQRGFIEVG